MSSYNSQNLFGSGPHKIVQGGELLSKKRTGYAGADGIDSMIMGGRGWPVIIRGRLRAASRAALEVLISAIEDAFRWGPCTLITDDGVNILNVELDRIDLIGTVGVGDYISIEYIVYGRKLF